MSSRRVALGVLLAGVLLALALWADDYVRRDFARRMRPSPASPVYTGPEWTRMAG